MATEHLCLELHEVQIFETEAKVNTRKQGAQKEEVVCAYLLSKGIRVCEQNFRSRQGEIDIIGYDGEYLVFFEVMYRSSGSKGTAAEAVGYAKQKRICRVADYYRVVHHCMEDTPIRFDVVAVDGENIAWIKDAFAYLAWR